MVSLIQYYAVIKKIESHSQPIIKNLKYRKKGQTPMPQRPHNPFQSRSNGTILGCILWNQDEDCAPYPRPDSRSRDFVSKNPKFDLGNHVRVCQEHIDPLTGTDLLYWSGKIIAVIKKTGEIQYYLQWDDQYLKYRTVKDISNQSFAEHELELIH